LQGDNLAPATPAAITSASITGNTLTMTGSGGTPNYAYDIVTSTDVTAPLSSWTVVYTGVTDGTGAVSISIPVAPGSLAGYFRLRMP